MEIDLRHVPFSRNGSYLAFSILGEDGERPEGLYLRSVHGGAQSVRSGGRVALVEVLVDGFPIPYQARVTPSGMDFHTVRGTLSICLPDPWTVRVLGEGVGLRLTFDPRLGDYAIPTGENSWRVNCPGFGLSFALAPLAGCWDVDSPWTGTGAGCLVAELLPAEVGGVCEATVEEFHSTPRLSACAGMFYDCRASVETEFIHWLEQAPNLPQRYTAARRLAAYINWSSVVEPAGHFLRASMFMSKNWMTSVWSWDHCFNAMALTYKNPALGWDQLMTLFDQQDECGALPDCFNDRSLVWNFSKPPIHGWVLNWMMQRTNFVRKDQVRQVYGPLCRWTEWWLHHRDSDGDGVPEYHHGNDSGWDNATPFLAGVPLETPDLCTFLALQMETLAKLAGLLGRDEESESWQRRSEELIEKMLAHFWQGDHFVAMRSGDHLVADTESLFLYLPVLLGKRLPAGVRSELVAGLLREGRFLTEHGFATESPHSRYYHPDGYWRGPIWAPSTLLIVEGLAACGETEMAWETARRFCELCAENGFAENFDAQTGIGLRDRAYTWTASTFLILGKEYLGGGEQWV